METNGMKYTIRYIQKYLQRRQKVAVKVNQSKVAEIELQKKQDLAIERLLEIDLLSLRPLRAQLAGTATQDDTDKLLELEAEAESLRELFKKD